jgi:hypothetical protein
MLLEVGIDHNINNIGGMIGDQYWTPIVQRAKGRNRPGSNLNADAQAKRQGAVPNPGGSRQL